MYTCYIIDDEERCIKALEGYIDKMPELVLLKSFSNPLLALEEIRLGVQPDIVFLDVNMPELSGLSIADLLPKHISIVFSTGHPKYALNAFEKDAVDFLLKPYSLRSYEIGKVKKNGTGPWEFWDFKHLLTAPVGMVGGREIEIINIDQEAYFSASAATVKLWYKIHRIGSGFGTTVPYYSSDFSKAKTYAPNDNQ
jgi:CheY-like chemotaxis protein